MLHHPLINKPFEGVEKVSVLLATWFFKVSTSYHNLLMYLVIAIILKMYWCVPVILITLYTVPQNIKASAILSRKAQTAFIFKKKNYTSEQNY